MKNKKYNLIIDLTNINYTIQNVENLKKSFEKFKIDILDFREIYLEECLKKIRDMSIEILDMKDTFLPSNLSGVRENISILPIDSKKEKWELKYFDSIVCFVEFGTGRIGGIQPHPLASREGYEYDVDSPYKDEMGYWSWANKDYDAYFPSFLGYKGKRFVYESFRNFINNRMYVDIYNNKIKELMDKYF